MRILPDLQGLLPAENDVDLFHFIVIKMITCNAQRNSTYIESSVIQITTEAPKWLRVFLKGWDKHKRRGLPT